MPHSNVRSLRLERLASTGLALALAFACTGQARAQAYSAGTGSSAGGTDATALGPNADASGDRAFAGGSGASAAGSDSVAIGSGAAAASANTDQGVFDLRTTPISDYPLPNEAPGTIVVRPSGTAIGQSSTVGTGGGVAVGYNNRAGVAPGLGNAYSSTAIGTNNDASGAYAIGLGTANTVSGISAIGLGTANQATGDYGVAIGRQAYAIGDYSFAMGFGATANQNGTYLGHTYGAIAIGHNAVAGVNNGGTTLAIGDSAIAGPATGAGDSIAFGTQTTATGQDALAIGAQTTASGMNTIAIGNNGTTAAGTNGVVLGIGSTVAAGVADATVLGSSAGATQSGGVALGFGAMALRGGLSGAVEAFSGVAVASTRGAVSVGHVGAERQITNLAGGTQDTDAVNLRQLRAAGTGLAGALGGGAGFAADGTFTAPSYAYGGTTYGTMSDLAAAIDTYGLRYDDDGAGNRLPSIDLTRGNALGPVTLRGVANGVVAVASTEAVNGAQLYETRRQLAQTVTALETGSLGLVQQDPTTRTLTVGTGTDGTAVDVTNGSGAARTLAGIAPGQVAAGSLQAVNGGQVYAVTASIADALGGGAGVAADGTLTGPSYLIRGTTYATVGGALGSLDAAVLNLETNGSRYVAVRSSGAAAQANGTDSVAIGPAAVAGAERGVALGANSRASRSGLDGGREAFSGIAVASTQGAVSVGDTGAERQITNVAGATQDTDAVNLRQLRAAGGSLAGSLGGGASFSSDGTYTAPSYAIAGRRYDSVGAALGAVDALGVRYDVDPATGGRGGAVTLAGGDPNQPVLIRNVAAGVRLTDAANTGQVIQAKAEANAYTDAAVAGVLRQTNVFGSQLADLNRQVGAVRSEARRGAAIGLAAGALRFDDRPGKISVAAGGGAWRGETAASFGLGYTLPDGSGRVNATGVAAGRDFGIGAGASFTLN